MDEKLTATEHRERASKHFQAKEDSFDRCDTDGFLSQWASGISGQLEARKAELAEAGWTSTFPGLYRRSDGARVRAKLIDARYGLCWAFCDEEGTFTGRFLSHSKGTKRSRLYREGFELREETAPANARITGSGTGLSGTAWVEVYRADGGYPEEAVAA